MSEKLVTSLSLYIKQMRFAAICRIIEEIQSRVLSSMKLTAVLWYFYEQKNLFTKHEDELAQFVGPIRSSKV